MGECILDVAQLGALPMRCQVYKIHFLRSAATIRSCALKLDFGDLTQIIRPMARISSLEAFKKRIMPSVDLSRGATSPNAVFGADDSIHTAHNTTIELISHGQHVVISIVAMIVQLANVWMIIAFAPGLASGDRANRAARAQYAVELANLIRWV